MAVRNLHITHPIIYNIFNCLINTLYVINPSLPPLSSDIPPLPPPQCRCLSHLAQAPSDAHAGHLLILLRLWSPGLGCPHSPGALRPYMGSCHYIYAPSVHVGSDTPTGPSPTHSHAPFVLFRLWYPRCPIPALPVLTGPTWWFLA